MNSVEFETRLREECYPFADRCQILIRSEHRLGGMHRAYESIYVNFIASPTAKGADAENLRASFWINGFHPSDRLRAAPTGKVKVWMSNSAFDRKEFSFRAKTATPEIVVLYLVDFLERLTKAKNL